MSEIPSLDCRLQSPASIVLAGASRSGKSTFVYNLLKNATTMFTVPPAYVLYCYKEDQPLFEKMSPYVSRFHKGMPDHELITELSEQYMRRKGGRSGICLVLDDLASEIDAVTEQVYVSESHHREINVLVITQNLFLKNSKYRTIMVNTTYLGITKSIRDKTQFRNFASQYDPGNFKWLLNVHNDVMKSKNYPHLWIDLSLKSSEILRIRSNIFGENNEPMICYFPKTDEKSADLALAANSITRSVLRGDTTVTSSVAPTATTAAADSPLPPPPSVAVKRKANDDDSSNNGPTLPPKVPKLATV